MTETSGSDRFNKAKTRIREVTAGASNALLAGGSTVFAGCREPSHCNLGRIPGWRDWMITDGPVGG